MKNKHSIQWGKLIISLVVPQIAGFIGSIFTVSQIGGWYAQLEKPSFNPPSWVFGPVWTVLYILMGVAFYFLWLHKDTISKKLQILFVVHLCLNALWSVLFFFMHDPLIAYVNIVLMWIMIVALILDTRKIDQKISWLLIPYSIWVTFASFLNLAIVILN
ncbi:MAG: TspO/MBR family protein [Candidatus Paceibacterota bacterium]